jgi:hypothetical protein
LVKDEKIFASVEVPKITPFNEKRDSMNEFLLSEKKCIQDEPKWGKTPAVTVLLSPRNKISNPTFEAQTEEIQIFEAKKPE